MDKTSLHAIGWIIDEFQSSAKNRESQAPDWYLDRAQQLASLWPEITKDLVDCEMAYKGEIIDLVETGDSVAKATMKIEATSENYRKYRYLKKKDEQVREIIMVAKKRKDNFIG